MRKITTQINVHRIVSLILAVMVTVTFVPLLGSPAFGEENKQDPAIKDAEKLTASAQAISYSVSAPNGNGIVTVAGSLTGALEGCTFYSLYVDNTMVKTPSELGASTINVSIDMKAFAVGYHTIKIYVKAPDGQIYYDTEQTPVPVYIYGAPANGIGLYESYNKYFFYKSSDNYYNGCSLYLQYRQAGESTWRTYGPMSSGTTYQVKGLKPNKKYFARTYYAKSFTYGGQDYNWTGPMSSTVSFKTGVAKTPIKSFKFKACKVKRHKVKHSGWYFGHYYSYRYKYNTYYYTYKLKAVVTMKKKPGAKGVYICGKWVKGNKKKYTVKLGGTRSSLVKPKKLSFTADVYTYQSKTYGGYSPRYYHKKKVK